MVEYFFLGEQLKRLLSSLQTIHRKTVLGAKVMSLRGWRLNNKKKKQKQKTPGSSFSGDCGKNAARPHDGLRFSKILPQGLKTKKREKPDEVI